MAIERMDFHGHEGVEMEDSMAGTDLPTDTESPVASEIVSSPVLNKQVKRDRIVILGRTQAGKTVFLASLYDACWNRGGSVQIEAIGVSDQSKALA